MATETERKFLVNPELLPPLDDGDPIIQAYLFISKKTTIRVRITPRSAYITVKGPAKGFSRPEFEYPIPHDDAIFMAYEMSSFLPVRKIRHEIMFNGNKWQVDEFQEQNAGLWIAEIEMSSPAYNFDIPPWVTREVSGDKRYLNSMLAIKPFTLWAGDKNHL